MRKYLFLAFVCLCLSARLPAQGVSGNLNAQTTDCTVTNACIEVDIPDSVGGATLKLSGTFSATMQFEASGDPLSVSLANANWVALNATPSNSTTAATSATTTGVWQANVAGFRRIRIRVSGYVSGTVAAAINLSTASARSGGGGGGGTIGGSIAANQVAFGSGANTIQGSAAFTYNGTTLIAPNGQFLGGGSCANNTAVGLLALAANGAGDCGIGINTAVGYHALTLNSSGVHNVAVGPALEANTTGGSNTAVGEGALNAISTASSNTAVGANALASATGGANSAFGVGACLSVTTGTSNTCIGGDVNAAADTNELILGGASSNKGAGSNTTTIGTTSTTDTWIGGNTGKSSLHSASAIFVGATSGSATIGVAAVAGTPNQINLPTTTGTTGQVLQTDGASPQQLSWITPVSSVSGTANQIDVATGTTTPMVSLDANITLPGNLTGSAGSVVNLSAGGANSFRVPNTASNCTASAGNAGAMEFNTGVGFEGCTSGAIYSFAVAATGGSLGTTCVNGQMIRSVNSNGVPTCTPATVATASVNLTGQTAGSGPSSACAATANLCNVAGQYEIHWNIWGSGTACATPGPGGVTISLTWTDENSVSHSGVIIPAISQTGATSTAVNVAAPTMAFQSALANESAAGVYTLSSSGAAAIQYTLTYVACTTGTGTFNLRLATTRLQ